MRYRFGPHALDLDRRELTRGGQPVKLQPQVFDLLAYLVQHHDRVVTKEELLERLWPDAVVLEASLQRAVSLARAALGDAGPAAIRTHARRGYRFVAEVEVERPAGPGPGSASPSESAAVAGQVPPVRYARSRDAHIAYLTLGAGTVDVVCVFGWTFPLRAAFALPELRANLERLAALGRVVLFDKRGTGWSDRAKRLPALDERMDDLRAVLDDVGSRRAVLVGFSEGGPLAMLLATSAPARVAGLVLVGSFARMSAAPDWPLGWSEAGVRQLRQYIASAWGGGRTVLSLAPTRAADPAFAAWASSVEREGASPGAALDLLEMNLALDVRPLLPAVRVPTVVLHARDDAQVAVENGRHLAAHIPGARLVEVPGDDHVFAFDQHQELVRAVAALVAGESAARGPTSGPAGAAGDDRFLGAVLCWTEGGPGPPAGAALAAGGWPLSGGVPGAAFASPRSALAAARALRATAAATSGGVGLLVHVGELLRTADGVDGAALATARELVTRVPAGELWVTQVVADLLPGSGLVFLDRGGAAGPSLRCLALTD